jgi:hypothetical protein
MRPSDMTADAERPMNYPQTDQEEITRLEAKVSRQRQEIERLKAENASVPQWTPQEQVAIDDMARQKGLSIAALYKQAMRLYHLHDARLAAGETVHWSGDAQRAGDFAGPLLADADDGICGAAPGECDRKDR